MPSQQVQTLPLILGLEENAIHSLSSLDGSENFHAAKLTGVNMPIDRNRIYYKLTCSLCLLTCLCNRRFLVVPYMSSSEIMHEFRSGRFSKSRGLSASVSSLSPPLPPTSLFRARPISRWKRLLRRLVVHKNLHYREKHLVGNGKGLVSKNSHVTCYYATFFGF